MTNFPVDRIIVSANENWLYLDFWPLVAYAYRTIFGAPTTLAFVTERLESDPFVAQLREHGDVVLIRPVRDIPQAAQCKMARYYVAAQAGDAVCYIEDIDWIPIRREWYAGKVQQRRPGTLLLIGNEVYGADENGQAPASMMTGEGHIFRALFNPDGLAWEPWLRSLGGRTGRHQDIASRVHNEGMSCPTDAETLGAQIFSDEALVVRLRQERPVPVTVIPRGYHVINDTVDRTYWRSFDPWKLEAGGYLGAHTGRPYLEHKAGNDAIMDYIRRRYEGGPVPPPIAKKPSGDPDMVFESSEQLDAFSWLCANVPAGDAVLEVGSGHVSTNYLSRYFELRSVEHDLSRVNIYPSFYIYAPIVGGACDLAAIRRGFSCYNTYRPHGAVLVNDSRYLGGAVDLLPVSKPIVIVDGETDDGKRTAAALAARTARPVCVVGNLLVV